MTTLLRAVAGVISAGLIAVPLWADPMPLIAPAPAWVEPVKIPAREPKASDLPAEMLVTSSQELLSPNGIETYVEYVMVPNSVAGLQSVGKSHKPTHASGKQGPAQKKVRW